MPLVYLLPARNRYGDRDEFREETAGQIDQFLAVIYAPCSRWPW